MDRSSEVPLCILVLALHLGDVFGRCVGLLCHLLIEISVMEGVPEHPVLDVILGEQFLDVLLHRILVVFGEGIGVGFQRKNEFGELLLAHLEVFFGDLL